DERPIGVPPLLTADLNERQGFVLSVRAGRSRYVSAQGDQGWWEWEPSPYISAGFRLDKWADDFGWQIRNMLTIVRRVLDTGNEDAAFFFNGDELLLTRLGGVLTKTGVRSGGSTTTGLIRFFRGDREFGGCRGREGLRSGDDICGGACMRVPAGSELTIRSSGVRNSRNGPST
ncbi:MAG: SitI3 family protein, partial [Actinomycetota bacterium]|nr:SitI3 family protein [Actinomycetota bacterium]